MIRSKSRSGFALPTVLLSAVVMLMILVTAVSVTSAIHSSIRDQNYTELATLAAEAGTVMATACMNQTGGQATWTNTKPLKPNTDCNGNVVSGASQYVLEKDDVRTYFIVQQPIIGAGNVPVSSAVKGYSEVLRSSSGVAWRVWSSDTSVALVTASDGLPVGSYIDGAWTTAPAGYLLANGAAVSRTTYANLFAVIGTTYGAGNGSTTFNLPDTRGRVSVNRSTDSEFDVLGEKGGAKSHNHGLANDSARAQIGVTGSDLVYNRVSESFTGNARFAASGGSSGSVSMSYKTLLEGDTSSSSSMQPYVTVNQAIKY